MSGPTTVIIFNSLSLDNVIYPTGITGGAFGTPTVAFGIEPAGITGGAFGTPALTVGVELSPTGIPSGQAFGTPRIVRRYTYTGSGVVTLGGTAPFSAIWNFDLVARYNQIGTFKIDKTFTYNIGELPMMWFRAEGVCKQNNSPNCATGGPIDESGMAPVPSMGDRPIDGSCPQNFIQIIPATTPGNVCKILKESGFVWRLNRLSKFSNPVNPAVTAQMAAAGLIDPRCNKITDILHCPLPECKEFCLEADVFVSGGMHAMVMDVFHTYTGSGTVHLSGTAPAEIVPPMPFFMAGFAPPPTIKYKAKGGLGFGGSAKVRSSHYRAVRSDVQPVNILIGGSAKVRSSHYRYLGAGGLTLSGAADVKSSRFRTKVGGTITLGGTAPVRVKKRYLPNGYGPNAPKFTNLKLGGTASASSGPLTERPEPMVFALADFNVDPTGIPTAEVVPNPVATPQLLPTGITGGAFGTATVTNPGIYTSYWGGGGVFESMTPIFSGIPAGTLVAPTIRVTNNCGCLELPGRLSLTHNLSRSVTFNNFLARNGFTYPSMLELVYNSRTRGFQNNTHFTGISNDGRTNELWHILFGWTCTSNFGGTDIGANLWQFSMLITRTNKTLGQFRETRMMAAFPPVPICEDANSNNGLDFTFDYNVITGEFITTRSLVVDISAFYDNLDMFTTEAWVRNPLFTVNISSNAVARTVPRMDIRPFFPPS